ncbi:unnamed protein product [Miscanthus lutarioriparius]|uniref:Uncharacterized protein n=1 Tax=Miscanthus lutarioriparius TaxID=422564 RepID=A0A811RLX2_9POAL|nr:unnamed protein product [Miscanthus lutarioriparius]
MAGARPARWRTSASWPPLPLAGGRDAAPSTSPRNRTSSSPAASAPAIGIMEVGTAQIATTGMVALSYVQKVSEKLRYISNCVQVSLASDFMYSSVTKDVTATFGYDYMLRQCRLRGKLDTNGVVSALLEKRLTPSVTFQLYAEVATAQIATTGMVALSYVHKVSENVSLASDFMYNQMTKDVTTTFGHDYMLRHCRLRGKLDTNGVVSALLKERLTPAVTFQLSAEFFRSLYGHSAISADHPNFELLSAQTVPVNPKPFLNNLTGTLLLSNSSGVWSTELANTEDYIDGQFSGNLGEILIRCNSVLYLLAVPEDAEIEDADDNYTYQIRTYDLLSDET